MTTPRTESLKSAAIDAMAWAWAILISILAVGLAQ